MDIANDVAPLVVPAASAIVIIIQNIANKLSISKRLSLVERTLQLLLLHDTHLPWSERLNAGKRYIDLGGNGSGMAYYEKLKEKYKARVEPHMEDRP